MSSIRIKSVVRNIVEKSDGEPRPFIGLEDVGSDNGQLLIEELPQKAADDSIIHCPSDVLFSKLRPYLAKSYAPTELGSATNELMVLRPGPEIDRRFLLYVTLSRPWIEWANTTAYGSKMPRTSWELMSEYRTWLPPLEKQRRIADFLDAETARIDRLVRLRRQQLELSEERLAAYATRLTGRLAVLGLEPAKSVVQLRRTLSDVQTGLTPPNLLTSQEVDDTAEVIPWYTPAALGDLLSLDLADKYVSASEKYPAFDADSVLVTGIGESLGKVGYLNHDATGNQQLTSLVSAPSASSRFIAWQLWSAEAEIREWAQYSRIRIINNDSLKSFPVYLPPREEQDSVAAELDNVLIRVRAIRSSIHKFEALIAERRQALITAAVTGQIDVSTASGRGIEE